MDFEKAMSCKFVESVDFDGPILCIESGDLLNIGSNFTVVLTSKGVYVYN